MTLLLALLALAGDDWLSPEGVGGLPWGSRELPAGAERKSRAEYLPDSGYISQQPQRPEDYRLPAPAGEQRFVRYADGALVDAWLVRQGPIELGLLTEFARPDWSGVVLGPASEQGWRTLGEARSWTVGARTLLHWSARMGGTEILASRSQPTSVYAVRRAAPVGDGAHPSDRTVRLSGSLKGMFKPHADDLSGCLDAAPKPVEATLQVRYDGAGRPGLLRVETDQPSFNVTDCMAGVIEKTRGEAMSEGYLSVYRTR